MTWTTPTELREQVGRLWDRGLLLRARFGDEPIFPKRLRLRRPTSRDLTDRFDSVQDWVRMLREGSRERLGYGYTITWRPVRHRVHGLNDVPAGVTVETEADALRLLGKSRAAERFGSLAAETMERFPELRPWIERRPLALVENEAYWERLLEVVAWFRANPRPGIYLRQLDIARVDTKFIEQHRGLLSQLLDCVLPARVIDESVSGVSGFEQRYGLLAKPPLVRFRILDSEFSIGGLTDVSVPPDQFAGLSLPVEQVFITENEINGLAFPSVPSSCVIFGLGYGLDRLAQASWLSRAAVHYWGDLDTHGFSILHRLRAVIPHARSFLMDRETLDAHQALWVQEPADRRFLGTLSRLTKDEEAVFFALRDDLLGERVRLEQERIGFSWLENALERLSADHVRSGSRQ